ERFFGETFLEWAAVENLERFDLGFVLLDVIAEGADRVTRGFGCFRVGAGKEKFVLRDSVDGLVGGALDCKNLISEIGIGGDGSDGFLNKLGGFTGVRPSMLFDFVGIDRVE